jgi:hypothetical protein
MKGKTAVKNHGGKNLDLPELSLANKALASSNETQNWLKTILHDEPCLGFPDHEGFRAGGVLVQPLSHTTARVLLVIDEERAYRYLAILREAYVLAGFELVVDEWTLVRQAFEPQNEATPQEKTEAPTQPYGMEVA